MTLALVDTSGVILVRSQSRTYLERKQKAERHRKTKIININNLSLVEKIKLFRQTKAAKRKQWKRAITGAKRIAQGKHLDSSWITELQWFPDGRAWALFEERKYTFFNIPEALFNAWFAGAAATTTSDPTGARRWTIYDFPSLGAFFNQRIKPKFSFVRGWI